MDAQEKIEYIRKNISEVALTSPSGPLYLQLYSVGHPDNPEEWTILTVSEQKRILKKLEENGEIKNLQFTDKNGVSLEVVKKRKQEKKTRRSNTLSYIKTTDQFLQNRELFEKFLSILGDFKNIQPKHKYTHTTEERNDDLIQLLMDLGLVEYDWDKIKKQTHREVGNRLIEFGFDGDKVIELNNRITGKNGRIKKEALELIAKEIGDRFTFNKIVETLTDAGVPQSMFVADTKWRAVFYVLSYYATSSSFEDWKHLLKIIEKVTHPLYFGGDEGKSKEVKTKYNAWLKYDKISIDINTGKAYISSTDEEQENGEASDEWYDSDGNTLEPMAYALLPNHLALLWVYWNQIILIVSASEANQALDKDELGKLYLELIGKTEELLEDGKIGNIKKSYKRPFVSLSTSHIEARAKGAGSPLELVSTFLLAITELEPDPTQIGKEMQKNNELVRRVASATRAIGGDKIDIPNLSHSQALFILKMTMHHMSNILGAVATGYILITDEELNAKYILLMDNLDEILNRDDFTELKKLKPEYLPEHLFQAIDEMDVWWECGGQSSVIGFIGDIESAWVRNGQQRFPISLALNEQFTQTKEIIANHKKHKQEKWDHISKKIDEDVKDDTFWKKNGTEKNGKTSEKSTSEPQKIIHEHTHRFENSIQEKEIDLNHKFVEDEVLVKNKKKISLPKFPRTEWSKVEIRFIDKNTVHIQAGEKTATADYEGLGFRNDKNGKPNTAWSFLFQLAKTNGETQTIPSPIPDYIKQHKMALSDRLKTIFKNDTDPFYDFSEANTYKIKLKLLPPTDEEKPDNLGVDDYLKETMTSQYEPEAKE